MLEPIENFLTSLGFRVERDSTIRGCFLPGILVQGITLRIDPERLIAPGDILHDAGHVAVIPSLFRPGLSGDIDASLKPMADEYCATHPFMIDAYGKEDPVFRGLLQCGDGEAQAWSYAAAVAIGIPPTVVFHPQAYDGAGQHIIAMLAGGRHFGVHGLRAAGMTEKRFPIMVRWWQL